MTFKVGDKVKATRTMRDPFIPAGAKGVITMVIRSSYTEDGLSAVYPYDVVFFEIAENVPVDRDEIESRVSWLRRWWRSLPAKDAERDFGNQETVDAFRAVQTDASIPVTIQGD